MEAGTMTRRINEMTWEAFRDRVPEKTDLVLVPVGTIEAHGAMALGTDTIIPEALASDLAPKLDALIAPAIAYGVTNSLLPYPGSTTVSSATFTAYLFEACAGLVDTGFRRVVILNGHGGQSDEVARVVARLWNEKKAYAVAIDWWGLAEEASTSIYPGVVSGHAGVEETAMVLAIAPDTIDGARAKTIRRAPRRSGVRARPFPASIILDKPETSGEGAPDLDPKKAKAFYAKVVAEIESALRSVFDGWAQIRPV
jgi:creatinine amidohydrolase